jgi:hypothetical protein
VIAYRVLDLAHHDGTDTAKAALHAPLINSPNLLGDDRRSFSESSFRRVQGYPMIIVKMSRGDGHHQNGRRQLVKVVVRYDNGWASFADFVTDGRVELNEMHGPSPGERKLARH